MRVGWCVGRQCECDGDSRFWLVRKQKSQQETVTRSSSIHYKHFFFESLRGLFIGRLCQSLPKLTTTGLAPRQMPRRFSFARQACFHPITIYNSYHRPFTFAASHTSPPVYGVVEGKMRTAQQQSKKPAINPPSPSASAPCLHQHTASNNNTTRSQRQTRERTV